MFLILNHNNVEIVVFFKAIIAAVETKLRVWQYVCDVQNYQPHPIIHKCIQTQIHTYTELLMQNCHRSIQWEGEAAPKVYSR